MGKVKIQAAIRNCHNENQKLSSKPKWEIHVFKIEIIQYVIYMYGKVSEQGPVVRN